MISTTVLNKSDTHSKSLKTTVPRALVSKFNLEKGSEIEWDTVILVDGCIHNESKGKKRTGSKIEEIIIIRPSGGKKNGSISKQ